MGLGGLPHVVPPVRHPSGWGPIASGGEEAHPTMLYSFVDGHNLVREVNEPC